jgi:hypothetical protein
MTELEDPRPRTDGTCPRLSSLLSQEALGRVLEKLGRILARVLRKQGKPERGDVSGVPSDDLTRLKRGESTLGEYLDAKVTAAVAPLEGILHADDLAYVRAVVRDKLEIDPKLRVLVQRLTKEVGAPTKTG